MKNVKRINESQLRAIVAESVKKVLKEDDFNDVRTYKAKVREAMGYLEQAEQCILQSHEYMQPSETDSKAIGMLHKIEEMYAFISEPFSFDN